MAASEEVVAKTDVANWTTSEDATEEVKQLTVQVKDKAKKVLSRKFKKFDATQFRSGTPGGTGSIMYAVKVDIGASDDKFVHLMISTQVVEKPTPKLERCALYFHKEAPLEVF